MRADTLKEWLSEKGASFEEHGHDRSQGHSSVLVKLEGKESVLPLVGTSQDLSSDDVKRIVDDLGLGSEELPGGQDTETETDKFR